MSQPEVDLDAFRAFEVSGWRREGKADAYHDFFGPITSRTIEPLLDAARVASGIRMLDVATGPGYVAARAAARGASAVGVDIASPMVELAGTLHPDVEFREGDAEQLPFADQTFQAVVGNFVILHLARPEQAVAEFTRVLTPGAWVALTAWDFPERVPLFGAILDAMEAVGASAPVDVPSGPPFFRFSADDEFSSLLRTAGLELVQVKRLSFTHRLSGADELWEGMIRAGVRTSALLLGQRPETQQQIRAALDRMVQPYAVDGGLELPVAVKLASGQKHG